VGREQNKNGAVASAVLGAPWIVFTSTGAGGSYPSLALRRACDPLKRLRRTRAKSIEI
jgi:hypothetical protein